MSSFQFINVSRTQVIDDNHKISELILTKIIVKRKNLHSCEVKATVSANKIHIHLPDIYNHTTDQSLRNEIKHSLMEYIEGLIGHA